MFVSGVNDIGDINLNLRHNFFFIFVKSLVECSLHSNIEFFRYMQADIGSTVLLAIHFGHFRLFLTGINDFGGKTVIAGVNDTGDKLL
jgi:hypothetical protein